MNAQGIEAALAKADLGSREPAAAHPDAPARKSVDVQACYANLSLDGFLLSIKLAWKLVHFGDLLKELALSSIAGMAYPDNHFGAGKTLGRACCIISHGDKAFGLQETDELREDFFAGTAFSGIMCAVSKRIVRLMRMQGEDVP